MGPQAHLDIPAVLTLVFWSLVALDLTGVLLWFLLGLAAAGSARTSPAAVTILLLVLPLSLLRGGLPLREGVQ